MASRFLILKASDKRAPEIAGLPVFAGFTRLYRLGEMWTKLRPDDVVAARKLPLAVVASICDRRARYWDIQYSVDAMRRGWPKRDAVRVREYAVTQGMQIMEPPRGGGPHISPDARKGAQA